MIYKARITPSMGTPDREGDTYSNGLFDNAVGATMPVLLEHGETLRGSKPIGVAKVLKEGFDYYAEIDFNEVSDANGEFKSLTQQGAYSVSVGFIPKNAEPNAHGGFEFKQSDLLEISLVSIPAVKEAKLIASKGFEAGTIVRKTITKIKENVNNVNDDTPPEKKGEVNNLLIINNKNMENLEEQQEEIVKKNLTPKTTAKSKKAVEVEVEEEDEEEEDEETSPSKSAKKSLKVSGVPIQPFLQNEAYNGLGFSGIKKGYDYVKGVQNSLGVATGSVAMAKGADLDCIFKELPEMYARKRFGSNYVAKAQGPQYYGDGTTAYTNPINLDGSHPFFGLNSGRPLPWATAPKPLSLVPFFNFTVSPVGQMILTAIEPLETYIQTGKEYGSPDLSKEKSTATPYRFSRKAFRSRFPYEALLGQDQFVQAVQTFVINQWIADINNSIINGNAAVSNTGFTPNIPGVKLNGLKDFGVAFSTTSKTTTPNAMDVMNLAIAQVASERYHPNLVLVNPAVIGDLSVTKDTQGRVISGANDFTNFSVTSGLYSRNGANLGLARETFEGNGGMIVASNAVAANEMYVLDSSIVTAQYCESLTNIMITRFDEDVLQGAISVFGDTMMQLAIPPSLNKGLVKVASISAAITGITKA